MMDIPKLSTKNINKLPIEWQVVSIQDLLNDKIIIEHLDGNHGEKYPKTHEFVNFGIPYISANDFTVGYVSFSNCKYLTDERAKVFTKGVSIDGDVLFAHNATVGPVALLRTNFPFIILSTTATFYRCDNKKLLNYFLLYVMQSQFFIKQYQAVMLQSTRVQVPITAQRKFKIFIPNYGEQTAIATALNDAVEVINKIEKLIEKKRAIKQGAMQELLKPKEGWEKKRIKDFTNVISGGTPSTLIEYYWGGNIRWMNSGELNLKKVYEVEGRITEIGLKSSATKMIPSNCILIGLAGQGKTRGTVAMNMIPLCTNQSIAAILPCDKVLPEFLYQNLDLRYNELRTISTGEVGRGGLNLSLIKNLQVCLPPTKAEQTSIARILSDMDAEIDSLEKKLAKYKAIKQGMMQVLLTGKVRLV